MNKKYTMPYEQNRFINVKKINHGSLLTIGKETSVTWRCDKHLNWFQKKMWNLFFGINVTDLKEE